MTIKEMEERTGLPRASIRFYEKEGLLSPARQENGYRIYSDSDLDQLKKLKLLRALGLSLEEIRSARAESSSLSALLQQRTQAITREQTDLQNADRILCQMYREQVTYDTLDADRYLEALQAPLPSGDVLPRVRSPWLRYFARYTDLLLWFCLYSAAMTLFTQENLMSTRPAYQLSQWLAGLLLTLALEPMLLHLFGTTPGKWLFGLSVTTLEGGRLSWAQALDRTFFVLRYGTGFDIPFYQLFRYYKSCRDCRDGEVLPWENDSLLVKKACTVRTAVLLPITWLLVLLLQLSLGYVQSVPDLRGDLDVERFSRNYNQMVKFYTEDSSQKLDSHGLWRYPLQNSSGLDVLTSTEDRPAFQYTLKDGRIIGIRLELNLQEDFPIWDPAQERSFAVSAFVRAQHSLFPWGDETPQVLRKLADTPFESWAVTANGITVTNEVHMEGYKYLGNQRVLFPTGDGPHSLSMLFSMEAAE